MRLGCMRKLRMKAENFEIELIFRPYPERPPEEQTHILGNIADDIWKEKMYLYGGRIENGMYIATMILTAGRKLRKKEKDTLIRKLRKLRPELEVQLKKK